ncbi:MAG: archease [Candidatus Altiarchaeales archaeon]|nr:MAG: archease [Candidatus Altiarchaeales archaeon]
MKHSRDFEFLEHVADLRFMAYGKSLNDCFQNSAKAMFSAISDLKSIDEKDLKRIVLKAEDLEVLLHDFLSELLFLFETEGLLFKKFHVSIDRNKGYRLKAELYGEKFNPKKHEIKTEIKAVTYHEMLIERRNKEWVAEVLCDI